LTSQVAGLWIDADHEAAARLLILRERFEADPDGCPGWVVVAITAHEDRLLLGVRAQRLAGVEVVPRKDVRTVKCGRSTRLGAGVYSTACASDGGYKPRRALACCLVACCALPYRSISRGLHYR
jgi:hypothetical protein